MRIGHRGRPASGVGPSFSLAAFGWVMVFACGPAAGAVAIGMRSWAPRTRTRCSSALSVLADYKRSRAGLSAPAEVLRALLAHRAAAEQTCSALQGYVSAARSAEDKELLPRVVCQFHCRMAWESPRSDSSTLGPLWLGGPLGPRVYPRRTRGGCAGHAVLRLLPPCLGGGDCHDGRRYGGQAARVLFK